MPIIVAPPRPEKQRTVRCGSCDSLIAYLPEEIERYDGHDYSGGPDGYERVKCPAPGCQGHGIIKRW